MTEKVFKVIDAAGIHARPATVLVTAAGKFESNIQIHYLTRAANLKSIMGVMALGIKPDSEFKISAEGNDAENALITLQDILEKESIAVAAAEVASN